MSGDYCMRRTIKLSRTTAAMLILIIQAAGRPITGLQKQETTMTADFQLEKVLLRKRHWRYSPVQMEVKEKSIAAKVRAGQTRMSALER